MIIKVCGMREAENIREASQLDINLMGFIFYPKSKRYVSMLSSRAGIIPDYSPERLVYAVDQGGKPNFIFPKHIKKVGVFVDDMPQNIITQIYNYDLDYVQLHGNESPVMIDNLRRSVDPDIHPGLKIIKAISVSHVADIMKCKAYEGHVDLFLFDTKCITVGGSGHQFDWSVLQAYQGDTPFLLSGGIGPDDVLQLKSFHHPKWAGIDVNSCFETEPALKNIKQLQEFIEKIRN